MIGIDHLARKFLHYRIFFIVITRFLKKRMYIRINFRAVSLEESRLPNK